MGSPLGPTFANFYMGHVEEIVFASYPKPTIYIRYVDDIFLMVDSVEDITLLRERLQENSVLHFTHELSNNKNQIHFLDTLITCNDLRCQSQVYVKPTDNGSCLNADGDCPDRYKRNVINNYLFRAYKFSENWSSFHSEVQRIKQTLINNNYTNRFVDHSIKTFVNNILKSTATSKKEIQIPTSIPLYYCGQMHRHYKVDEKVLKGILATKVTSATNVPININIYYRNKKTHNLVIRNNCSPTKDKLQSTHLVYEFKCPIPHCKVDKYIGSTTTTLSRRLTMHLQNGSILQHFNMNHGRALKRKTLVDNVSVIAKEKDIRQLRIKEALLILQQRPEINRQFDKFPHVLTLYELGTRTKCGDEMNTINRLVGDDGTNVLPILQVEEMDAKDVVAEEVDESRVPEVRVELKVSEEIEEVKIPDDKADEVADLQKRFSHLVDNINITERRRKK